MHFGKRLAAFRATGCLRSVDYKALKKIIKSGQFADFWSTMEAEIGCVSTSVQQRIDEIETSAGKAQLALVQFRQLFTPNLLSHFRAFLQPLSLTLVADDKLVTDMAEIYQKAALSRDRVHAITGNSNNPQADDEKKAKHAVSSFVEELSDLLAFLDINACGFRKIVKKFAKRSGGMPTPPFANFVDFEAVHALTKVAGQLVVFGAPATSELGEEIQSIAPVLAS